MIPQVHRNMSQAKCDYFDKGYCKQKTECTKLHPSLDCDRKCENKNTCPLRHRVVCKNGEACIFLASQSCSFLHPQLLNIDTNEIRDLKEHIKTVNGHIASFDKKIKLLEKHADTGFPKSDLNRDIEQKMEAIEKESEEQNKKLCEMKVEIKMAFDKINDIDEEYSNKFIETFEELPIEEIKNSNRLLVEKIKSLEKKVSVLIIKENNREKNQTYPSKIVSEGECDMADDRITMKPIITTHQQKIYYDEDFEKFQCEQCSVGFLKKWLLAKHVKDIHLEERRNDSSDKNSDQPQIEDQLKHIEYVQESVFESVVNNDLSSPDKHTPKGEELNCVIC